MNWDRIFRPDKYRIDDGIRRDPLSIGVSILVNIGYTGVISGFGATLLGSVVLGAIGIGASLISNYLFSPKAQQRTSSDQQITVRQTVGARYRYYGRVKVGGTVFFIENRGGNLFQGVTLNEGQISAIREVWLNDQQVTIDGSGLVNEEPYVLDDGAKVVRFSFHYGTADQLADGFLLSFFPGEYLPNDRLRGVANYVTIMQDVPQDQIATVYPQLNPTVRIVMDASLVKSVRTGAIIPSALPADCIYDYLTGLDGAGFAYGSGYLPSQVNLQTFQDFAAVNDENVPLKAGGTIKRYRLWGGYGLNEQQRDVLPRMLATCDGDLYLDTDGKICIRGGKWVAPALTLDSDSGHIISGEFSRGRQALASFNELTITYVEPNLDYQDVEGERWLDSHNIALRGKVLSAQLDLPMVPHHAQARRLAKIHTNRNNPEWSGRIITNFYGMNAIGERMVRIKFGPLGIDTTFEIKNLRILDDISGVELIVSSLTEDAYFWDAILEEGTGPTDAPDTSTPISLPPPDNIAVTTETRTISGSTVGRIIVVTWTEPSRTSLLQEAQYRLSPSGDWIPMLVADGVGRAESGIVTDGATYNVRVRTGSPAGTFGPWTDPVYNVVVSPPFQADNGTVRVDTTAYRADRA